MAIAASHFWVGKRVLLTGHTGFKGSWLLLWLLELGAEVWCYALEAESEPSLFRQLYPDLLSNSRYLNRFHHHIGDLADFSSLSNLVFHCQPQIVFHLAAQPLVRRSYVDPVGTWSTNLIGSLHLLEALKCLLHSCSVVMVTTDKVYENRECIYGYRESDRLGGHDPYSASKAGAEIAIASWRTSFCGIGHHQTPYLHIATARSGNVIGGGDWAADRIVPDAMQALFAGRPLEVRNPTSTRPWQHVLEPLAGYLSLAKALSTKSCTSCEAFNFGPNLESNRTVADLVESIISFVGGSWYCQSIATSFHESILLHLHNDKAYHLLDWKPHWNYLTTVERTVAWYSDNHSGKSALSCCLADLDAFT